jgi:membrane protease YdiL (CAAX protease family)
MAPPWWGTLLYVPLLYGIGWVVSRPLLLLAPGLRLDQVDLVGVVIAFALLLATLPGRLRRVWGEERPWRRLGLGGPVRAGLRAFGGGLLQASLLLAGAAALLLLAGQARWSGRLDTGAVCNALALVLGVGFAEELLFRGWLWGELELQLGTRRALPLQAAIFALLHPWAQAPGLAAVGLLGGLVLLGLALALRRRADGGPAREPDRRIARLAWPGATAAAGAALLVSGGAPAGLPPDASPSTATPPATRPGRPGRRRDRAPRGSRCW